MATDNAITAPDRLSDDLSRIAAGLADSFQGLGEALALLSGAIKDLKVTMEKGVVIDVDKLAALLKTDYFSFENIAEKIGDGMLNQVGTALVSGIGSRLIPYLQTALPALLTLAIANPLLAFLSVFGLLVAGGFAYWLRGNDKSDRSSSAWSHSASMGITSDGGNPEDSPWYNKDLKRKKEEKARREADAGDARPLDPSPENVFAKRLLPVDPSTETGDRPSLFTPGQSLKQRVDDAIVKRGEIKPPEQANLSSFLGDGSGGVLSGLVADLREFRDWSGVSVLDPDTGSLLASLPLTSVQTTDIHIGNINIQTQATEGYPIAADIGDGLRAMVGDFNEGVFA